MKTCTSARKYRKIGKKIIACWYNSCFKSGRLFFHKGKCSTYLEVEFLTLNSISIRKTDIKWLAQRRAGKRVRGEGERGNWGLKGYWSLIYEERTWQALMVVGQRDEMRSRRQNGEYFVSVGACLHISTDLHLSPYKLSGINAVLPLLVL